jgi:predicted Co/Zn/Cd cation transporter (cation efflux family)
MKDKKLRKYIYRVLAAGIALSAFFAVLYLIFGGIYGNIALGTLLSLAPARLLAEVYGFAESKNYGFALISLILFVILTLEFYL